ncbi:MAG: hypothetical protein HOF53_15210 [Gammaproteobacteria bacterium]|jgi:polysaccharide pyruvyl transferase WcaK-like protein|nr:hypothetical protein [Gammaproteobacteria bacterium]MBT3870100.1 hypothetical protein [Gammaproteobacteria bacterium]MBT5199438.1 hypothetical protein [Gammaproteobacteria bacterium]MBT7529516.1 hypothetical protein [Gammaproteobacteria bacterium]
MNRYESRSEDAPRILLLGNGPYQNRGCEAILRGTMEILRHAYDSELNVQAGVVATPEVVNRQNAGEMDPQVDSFSLRALEGPRWSPGWFQAQSNRRFGTSFSPHLKDLKNVVGGATVAMQVGGDHYSLDYGRPTYFMAMDEFLFRNSVPTVLWGASVGPFDSDPVFAKKMFNHLRRFSAILVRERESLEYLQANGVADNVHLMADPAFLMKPSRPDADPLVAPGTIGINLSPMLAFYRGLKAADVDIGEWTRFCTGLVVEAASFGRPILLIPHVGSSDPGNDDFSLLEAVCSQVSGTVPVDVQVLPRGLNAPELKWVISQCAVFVGARTHSTIAALSSAVPTLSIGYSRKARGINLDLYGHLNHCLDVGDLDAATFSQKLDNLIVNEADVRSALETRIPALSQSALVAGTIVRRVAA